MQPYDMSFVSFLIPISQDLLLGCQTGPVSHLLWIRNTVQIGESLAWKSVPPVIRQEIAAQHSSMQNFNQGYAKDKRQTVNQRLTDRKTKMRFTSFARVVDFIVGVAKFSYDSSMKRWWEWKAMLSFHSVNEDNRASTSDQLARSLLSQAQSKERSSFLKWTFLGEPSDWSLAHNNVIKGIPRSTVLWTKPRPVSSAIEAGCYEQRSNSPTKLFISWLFFIPEASPTPATFPTPSPKPVKKEKNIHMLSAGELCPKKVLLTL